MTFIGTVELLGLLAALCALLFWLLARAGWLRRDSSIIFGGLILLTVFLNLSDALEYNRLTRVLDPVADNLEVLRPLLWGVFLYSFVQTVIQREIQERERQSELLLANLPHMVSFKDDRFVYLSVNEKFARELGLSPRDVVGKRDSDLFPPAVAEELRADDRRAIETGQAHSQVMTTESEDGQRLIEVTRVPVTSESEGTVGLLTIRTDITDRRKAEEALRKTELEKEAILDSMSEIVVYQGPDMEVLWANRAAAESVDMEADQMVGRKCYQVWQHSEAPCPGCPVVKARSDGQPHEGQVTTFDGRAWLIRGYPVPADGGGVAGVVEVAEEVTQKKQARDAAAQLAAIVEASDDAIIGLSAEGAVTSWNPGAERIYGYEADEFLGRRMDELAPSQFREGLNEAIVRASQGESIRHYETICVTRGGRAINVSLTICPIFGDSGSVTGISVIARDITEQARLRDELRMLTLVDPLTELHNRRGFFHLAKQQLKVAHRTGEPVLLFYSDVDGLKRINDSAGHKTGDQALMEISNVLRETFRDSDIIGRLGGDEFAILALDAVGGNRHEMLARLQENLKDVNEASSRSYELSLSVGVAVYKPKYSTSLDELLAEADALMYEHKRAKRDAGLR